MRTDYDVIIIGGGPAGLTAALYTSRARLSTLILEKESMGGELVNRELIENYPCAEEGVQGPDLAAAMAKQAMNFGAKFEYAEVESIEAEEQVKIVHCDAGDYSCKGIIIASGAHPRKLGIPGEEEYEYAGVFYCGTCDGPMYDGKTVAVAGGGDSAVTEALALARYASHVTIIARGDLRAAKVLQERAQADPAISILRGTKITAVVGGEEMTGLELEDSVSGEKRHMDVQGLLVRIGMVPNTQYLEGSIELTEGGQIPVNEVLATAIPGVYAAGDVREHSPMQISTAVGDGACAAMALAGYIAAQTF